MKIIDNFLSKSYYNSILELLSGFKIDAPHQSIYDFVWQYHNNITGSHLESSHFNEYGFTHSFWGEESGPVGQFGFYIQPLLFQIMDVANCDFVLRARADMVTWSKEDFTHPAHTDFPFPNSASVFYINETDGDTIFYNVEPKDVPKDKDYKDLKEYDRVSPSPNRLVLFDGDFLHTGCSPIKHKNRILINSNYIKKKYVESRTDGNGGNQGFKILEEYGQENREAMNNVVYS